MAYGALVLALVFNMLAQFTLKTAVARLGAGGLSLAQIPQLITVPLIWVGVLCYGGSFVFYLVALSSGELGKIGLVSQALTILGLLVLSVVVFHEPLRLAKVVGVVLLLAGVVALSL